MRNMFLTLPLNILSFLGILFSKADDGDTKDDDKTSENEDDLFGDYSFGDDEDDDDSDDDKDDDKTKEDKKDSKSAIVQKQKYRKKLEKANKTIKELQEKKEVDGKLTDTDKKELEAEKYIAKIVKKQLDSAETARKTAKDADIEKFQDELDEILEDDDTLDEDTILELCKDLLVSPKQAAKILQREKKLGKGTKPKLPDSKRAKAEVEDDSKDKDKDKPTSFEDIGQRIKDRLRKKD